jgi:hypothetical protein
MSTSLGLPIAHNKETWFDLIFLVVHNPSAVGETPTVGTRSWLSPKRHKLEALPLRIPLSNTGKDPDRFQDAKRDLEVYLHSGGGVVPNFRRYYSRATLRD